MNIGGALVVEQKAARPRGYVGPKNGCHHHPDCFTCPFPDCRLHQTGTPGVVGAPKRYQCDVCGKKTSFLSGARSHLRAAHANEGGFVKLAV